MNRWQRELIEILNMIFNSTEFRNHIPIATQENPWFTAENITRALSAIQSQMLSPEKVEQWIAHYPRLVLNQTELQPTISRSKKVGIIMAGNIPLVGFHDLLSVLMAGHRAVVKPSSKDSILITHIVGELSKSGYGVELSNEINLSHNLDALLMMGGKRASDYFTDLLPETPKLIRSNRHSIAILDGNESQQEIQSLVKDDMFSYWGLGCRNVTHLYLPRGYKNDKIPSYCSGFSIFQDNYRYRKALYGASQQKFHDKQDYLLVQDIQQVPIAVARYSFYDLLSEISLDEKQLQCVVTNCRLDFPRIVAFGQTQNPTLLDYPDSRDTLEFLLNI